MYDERSVEEREEERLMRNINKKKNQPRVQTTQTTTQPQPPQQPTQQNPPTKVNQPSKTPSKFLRPKKTMDREVSKSGMTIRMKNEAQKQQIKEHESFVAWANWVLKGSGITINNLTKDLEDGTKLGVLAQILTRRDNLKLFQNPKLNFHKYENINVAAGALKEKIPTLKYEQTMFEKEQLSPILGFFYQLITNFSYGWGRDEKKDKNDNKGKSIADIAFGWVEEVAGKYPNCKDLKPTVNGTKDFKSGELILAIMHDAMLGTGKEFKLKDYENKSPDEIIDSMIDLAQKNLGIPKFFHTVDITNEPTPQERLIVPWLLAIKAEVYQTHLTEKERDSSCPVMRVDDSERQQQSRRNLEEEEEPILPSNPPPMVSNFSNDLPLPEETNNTSDELEKGKNRGNGDNDNDNDNEFLDKNNNGLGKGNGNGNDENIDKNNDGLGSDSNDGIGEEIGDVEVTNEGLNTTDDLNITGNIIKPHIATEKEQNESCTACHIKFKKESIVVVNGDLYHEKCFVCHTCKGTFSKFYWTWEGLPYCFDHYQDVAGLICKKCTKKISDEVVVVAVGSKWHQTCFSCKVCNTKLEDKFYFFEDNIYCDKDYFKVAGDVCGACFEPIRGQLIVEALKQKWHSICFACHDCHIRFLPEDENQPNIPFYNNDGKPYCNDCDAKYHGLKNAQICAKCNKPITGSILQAMKKTWHDSCFVCTSCGDEFTTSYVNISNQPYCNKCADKL